MTTVDHTQQLLHLQGAALPRNTISYVTGFLIWRLCNSTPVTQYIMVRELAHMGVSMSQSIQTLSITASLWPLIDNIAPLYESCVAVMYV